MLEQAAVIQQSTHESPHREVKRIGGWKRKILAQERVIREQEQLIETLSALVEKYQAVLAKGN